MSDLTIIEPRSASEMEAFRALNWAYRDFLAALPAPHNAAVLATYGEAAFRAVLEAAEVENRPPRGMMRLMLQGEDPVGCGTVQSIGPGDAEIKRVFVSETARGIGAGRHLMTRLVEDCRDLGFRRILMDTGQILSEATALYDSMGFQRRGPYGDLPEEATALRLFFEMRLD